MQVLFAKSSQKGNVTVTFASVTVTTDALCVGMFFKSNAIARQAAAKVSRIGNPTYAQNLRGRHSFYRAIL
ncbi:MAG: hypothetical protein C4557_04070, partial [Anaerolineaceae bacterium]